MTAGALHETKDAGRLLSVLPDERWIALVRRYLKSWGVADDASARIGAQRLVFAVLTERSERKPFGEHGNQDQELRRQLIERTQRWVQHFALSVVGSAPEAFFRAPSLLSKFPRAFLETPIPAEHETDRLVLSLLPPSEPRPMMQQAIVDSLEHVANSFRDAVDRIRGVPASEAPRLVEPS